MITFVATRVFYENDYFFINRFHSILHTWIWMSKYDIMKTTFSTISQLMSCPYWLRFYIVVLGIAFLFFVTFFLLFPISIWTFNPLFCLDIYFPFPFGLLLPFSIWTFFPFFNSFLFQFFFFLFFSIPSRSIILDFFQVFASNLMLSRLCKEHCYRKKTASVGQNGRLSNSCNFFSFWLTKPWGTTN